MKPLRRLLLALTAAATGTLGAAAAPQPAAAAPPPAQQQQTYARQLAQVLDLHNAERRAHGLDPLRYAPALAVKYSQPYNDKLADADARLEHQDLSALEWPGARTVGENLYYGSGSHATPQAAVDGWMRSEGHRENILNPEFSHIAVGWSVSPSGRTYSTVNFWGGSLQGLGTTYATGAELLAGAGAGSGGADVNVYTQPGHHTVNGRQWRTTCEPYSASQRCTAEIWATVISYDGRRYTQTNRWNFNNLTYLPMARSTWHGNPLARTGTWVSDGRRWETSCDDAWTGPNGCRSFVHATIIESWVDSSGQRRYRSVPNQKVFNNIVTFS